MFTCALSLPFGRKDWLRTPAGSYLQQDELSPELAECVSKTAVEDPSALMARREYRLAQLEAKAAMYRVSGATQEWFSKSV